MKNIFCVLLGYNKHRYNINNNMNNQTKYNHYACFKDEREHVFMLWEVFCTIWQIKKKYKKLINKNMFIYLLKMIAWRGIPVIPRSNQIGCILRTSQLFKTHLSVLNTSETGRGKTHTTFAIAQRAWNEEKWKMAVIAPNRTSLSNDDGWVNWSKKYGVPLAFSMTYAKLRGQGGKINHPYLVYDDKEKSYHGTKAFGKLCREGLILVFDECHHGTRPTSKTHWAMAALTRICAKYSKKCRIMLLSKTPGDKAEHMAPILRIMGIVRKTKMVEYDRRSGIYEWEDYGLAQLRKYCFTIATRRKVEANWEEVRKGSEKRICTNMWVNILRSATTVYIPAPKDIPWKLTALNAYFNLNKASVKLLNKGINVLSNAVHYHEGVLHQGEWNMGGIVTGLKMIECAKLPAIANYVQERLIQCPRKKFVICIGAQCLKHQQMLQQMIPMYWLEFTRLCAIWQALRRQNRIVNGCKIKVSPWRRFINKDIFKYIIKYCCDYTYPTIMNGKTKEKERNHILRTFQNPDSDIRVLIMSPGVGSEAISLHDKYGQRQREIIISPDHFHTRVVQSAGRVWRTGGGQASDAHVLIAYGHGSQEETSVLNCMVTKAAMSRNFISNEQEALYPGEYPSWVEGDKMPKGVTLGGKR